MAADDFGIADIRLDSIDQSIGGSYVGS